jgi:Zn-dependent M32 family carboxypeptidase
MGSNMSVLSCCCLQAYDELTAKLRELDALNGISGLLGWDELVSSSSSSNQAGRQTTSSRISLRAVLHVCAALLLR